MSDLPLADHESDRDWRPALASALLAAALFAVTLGGTYIYDDLYIIGVDTRLKDPAQWGKYWTKDYFNGGVDNLYRPLVSMSYAIQWWLHGDRPWAYHLVNVLLHATASACVAELARRLAGTRPAYVAGLLFAAHPVHVEAVANVVGRAELACGAAVAGALLVFARRPLTVRRAVAVWALLVCAVLSKEQGLLLPPMLVALHLLDRGRRRAFEPLAPPLGQPDDPDDERKAMRTLVLLVCWTMASYIVFRENILKFWWDRVFLDPTQNPMVEAHGRDRLLMPLVLFGRYVQLLIVPHKLSIDYGGRVIGSVARLNDPYLWTGVVAAVAWCAAIVTAVIRRNGAVTFCLLCFAMVYGLIGNIVTIIGTNFGERLMYLPSAFFLILVGIAVARLRQRALPAAMVVVMSLACLRTFTYAARWNDRLAFHQSQVRAQPTSVRVHLLLADEWIRRKEYARADEVMATAREVQPDYSRAWEQSAAVALLLGDVDRAEKLARRAVEIDPIMGMSQIWTLIAERRAATQPSTATSTPTTSPAQ